jgi:penicillin-insensitive murein DD-endopeptidase
MSDSKKYAEYLVNKHKGFLWGINEGDLGREMSTVLGTNAAVVYYVFEVLEERGYDTATIIRITRLFLDATSQAVLNQIAATSNGRVVIKRVIQIIKCDSADNKGAARCMKLETARDIGTKVILAQKAAKAGNGSAQPKKLSDVEMDWYANYNASPIALKSGKVNNFDATVCWQLPREGSGFVVYSPDDLDNAGRKRLGQKLLDDNYGYDQIGTKETIETMILIAKEWSVLHSDNLLQYGDVSRPGGVNTPDHATHMDGRAFDVRPLRNDSRTGVGANLVYTDSSYHRDFTKDFIRIIKKIYPQVKILFNDSKIHGDKEFSSYVRSSTKEHDNHLHVIFIGGK